jgi:gliding motility-associated-like protein
VCEGNNVVLTSTSTVASGVISQYLWDYNFPSTNTAGAQSVSNNYPVGTHNIQLTVISNNGCRDSIVQNVTVHPLPIVNFIADVLSGCEPLCVQFTNQSLVGGGVISNNSWSFGDNTNSSDTNPIKCYNDGTYNVSLSVTSNFGCTNATTQFSYITVYPNPTAGILANPNYTSITQPNISFVDASGGNISDVIWNYGDSNTNDTLLSDQNIVHTYADTGTFVVTQWVISDKGCRDSVTTTVYIAPDWAFYIPNTFTPSADGLNDFFNGKGFGIIEYELLIFDRWGENIAKITDINDKGWDGKRQGSECKADVYVYEVRFRDVAQRAQHKYLGTVTLMR